MNRMNDCIICSKKRCDINERGEVTNEAWTSVMGLWYSPGEPPAVFTVCPECQDKTLTKHVLAYVTTKLKEELAQQVEARKVSLARV